LRSVTGDSESELFQNFSSQIMEQSARFKIVAGNPVWEEANGRNAVGISATDWYNMNTASLGASNEDLAAAIRKLQ